MSFTSYTENKNIFNSLMRELYYLFGLYLFNCEGLGTSRKIGRPFPQRDTLISRIKILKSISRETLEASFKFSYLNETDYQCIVEWLDNIYIQNNRRNIIYYVSKFGVYMSDLYDEVIETLGQIDERLKTIRIVSSRNRLRNYNCNYNGIASISNKNNITYEIAKPIIQKPDRAILPTVISLVNNLPTHVKDENLFDFFKKRMLEIIKEFTEINILWEGLKIEKPEKLMKQCKIIAKLFTYIKDNAEYISTSPIFIKELGIKKPEYNNFCELCIYKCKFLTNDINETYDKMRRESKRSNPELRETKSIALKILDLTHKELCKYQKK